ncbi:uncharacterized protein TrAtP1_004809 [Trichoderma atroviride]|uniref:Uncharacterized protein n=1 Tax=Hypocrea atroviridis (strain ATCC 20476 / IMI 206040) TaxID=452589 RepID=G9P5Q9_HYPAI|nr:uncharacterized protein TRIATDRAFT_321585 [Trichoderma atroviride IMI 206040]EHK41351.1 hypothetical protein TRIATDRAFT_321585 [Trichoderma atroviride IMI 206040]UKZ63580.1 hypothetical protein TrAtP1_004809 [Trichoderma atroviride]
MSKPAPSLLQCRPPAGLPLQDFLRQPIPSIDDRLDRKHDDETKDDEEADASLDQITMAPLFFESVLPFKPPLMHVRCHCSRAVLVYRKQQLYQRIRRDETGCDNGEKYESGKRDPRCED